MDYRGLEKRGRDKPSVYIFKKTLNNYGSCQFTLNLQNDHFTFRAINLFFSLGGSSAHLFSSDRDKGQF